jgi:hypothetical protein
MSIFSFTTIYRYFSYKRICHLSVLRLEYICGCLFGVLYSLLISFAVI